MQAGLRPPSREPGAPGAGRWERELAARLGTTALSVHRWEHGVSVPTPHFRRKLCALFGMSERELGLRSPLAALTLVPGGKEPRHTGWHRPACSNMKP